MNLILLILIKKEIIQFFRSKSNLIIMFIFPITLIFIIGKSSNGFMRIEKDIFNNKIIYYRVNNPIENEVDLQRFYDFIIYFEKMTNARFIQNSNYQDAILHVNNNKAICFIDIYDNDINYFRNKEKETIESIVFRNLYEQYLKKYIFLRSIYKSNPQQIKNILDYEIKVLLRDEEIAIKEVNSFTYYTFGILVLMILYISNFTYRSAYNEKLLILKTRSRAVTINKINILLSKIALGMIIGIVQIIVVYLSSTTILKVNWGENLLYIFIVLISFIIFSSVLGVFMLIVFKNQKTAYVVNNIVIIIMGFLGGSYVPIYLVKSVRVTSYLAKFMPSYWANISLLSLSNNIQTKYYITSITISLGLSVLLLILGNFISKLKVGGSFD